MDTFKVATFNMQFGQAWDQANPDCAPVCIAATAAFIQSLDADILLLQELEQARKGGEQVQPPPHYTFLKEKLPGYDSAFAYPTVNPQELPFGVALATFSRTPLSDFQCVQMPPADIQFTFDNESVRPSHRQLIIANTHIAGRELRIMNAHPQAFFMINSSSNEHRSQRDIIEKYLRASHLPTILGGDFNCAPGENLVPQFESAGYHTAQKTEITWRRRPYVLDHLFYNAPLRVISHKIIPTPCSDHHALVAEFAFS